MKGTVFKKLSKLFLKLFRQLIKNSSFHFVQNNFISVMRLINNDPIIQLRLTIN